MGSVARKEREGEGERTETARTVPRMPVAREGAQGERGESTVA